MRKRPAFHKAIGDRLKAWRAAKGWGLRQAASIAEKRGFDALTRQVIFRMERGQVKNPDALVLQQFAAMYGEKYIDLAREFVEAQYGLDVVRGAHLPRNSLSQYPSDEEISDGLSHPDTANGVSSAAASIRTISGGDTRGPDIETRPSELPDPVQLRSQLLLIATQIQTQHDALVAIAFALGGSDDDDALQHQPKHAAGALKNIATTARRRARQARGR